MHLDWDRYVDTAMEYANTLHPEHPLVKQWMGRSRIAMYRIQRSGHAANDYCPDETEEERKERKERRGAKRDVD
jgi:hypothetical protein